MRKGLRLALGAAAAGGLLVRWLGKSWGANDREVNASLAGDEVIPHPMLETTHAISIQAPPSAVWPWLAQGGYRRAGRGGWYTDAWWDPFLNKYVYPLLTPPKDGTAVRVEPSADSIIPELQHVAVGDIVPDGPPGTVWFTVSAVKPGRCLVLYSDTHLRYMLPAALQDRRWAPHGEFTWTFALEPRGANATRLILRTRARFEPRLLRALLSLPLYLADFLFARQLLQGVKQRAERFATPQRATRTPATPAASARS